MKVKEIIAKLAQFDPEMRVLVAGYESGLDDPDGIRVRVVASRGYDSLVGSYTDLPFDSLAELNAQPADLRSTWIPEGQRAFEAVVIPR